MAERARSDLAARTACGVLAGPLFVVGFTAIASRRPEYDWQRNTVSSLAIGPRGWPQRANFILAGALYAYAAHGLRSCPRSSVGPRVVPTLVAAAGVGLIGSGVFVTDPSGFPPERPPGDESGDAPIAEAAPTLEGTLHNLCAVPIFVGIPAAGLAGAVSAARGREYGWALYSVASSMGMAGSFVLVGRAFGGMRGFAGKVGIFQRLPIVSGFGWLTGLSLRAFFSRPRT